MDYKQDRFSQSNDVLVRDKNKQNMIEKEASISKTLITQLKNDKKRLQEALRKVISERDAKTEKLKTLKAKYLKLEDYLKKESEFIKDFHQDYQILQQKFQNQLQAQISHSKHKKRIESLLEGIKPHMKLKNLQINYDEKQ